MSKKQEQLPPHVLEQERTWRIVGVILVVALIGSLCALVATGCGQEWFPTCKDPKHPCPPVEPDYPPSPPFAARDAGADG